MIMQFNDGPRGVPVHDVSVQNILLAHHAWVWAGCLKYMAAIVLFISVVNT